MRKRERSKKMKDLQLRNRKHDMELYNIVLSVEKNRKRGIDCNGDTTWTGHSEE